MKKVESAESIISSGDDDDNAMDMMRCKQCNNPVALSADILSKSFVSKSGKAYMLSEAMNVVIGPKQNKQLMTGYYTIAPIFCSRCGEEMGWTYLRAFDPNHAFKQGRYILELSKICFTTK